MAYINLIKNQLRVRLDPEIAAIRHIVSAAKAKGNSTDECDDIFIQRLKNNPGTFKFSFWEKHFEWQALKDYPEINGRILDFGCGSGHSDIILARNGYKIHGVDLSDISISIANYLHSKEDAEIRQRLSFSRANIITDFPEQPFDSAWSSHVFEHIADPVPVLKGLKSWLKPGAYMLISVPLGYAYDDPGHANHFADGEDLAKFIEDTIIVERIDVSLEFQVIRALCRF